MRERLEHEVLAWIKTLALQPAGFQVVQAKAQGMDGDEPESRKWDWVIDATAKDSNATIRLLVEVMGRVTPQTALGVLARMKFLPDQGVPLLCCPDIIPACNNSAKNMPSIILMGRVTAASPHRASTSRDAEWGKFGGRNRQSTSSQQKPAGSFGPCSAILHAVGKCSSSRVGRDWMSAWAWRPK